MTAPRPLSAAERRKLLERHRPSLHYHPQEAYFADSPAIMTDSFLGSRYSNYLQQRSGKLIARSSPSLVGEPLTLQTLTAGRYPGTHDKGAAATDYLNAHEDTHQQDAARMHARPDIAHQIYGCVRTTDRHWLQYWFFFYFNHKSFARLVGNHEGDWEMIQIGLDRDNDPELATYAQHSGAEKRDWDDVRKGEGSDDHRPLVYVALGSHASYFEPGEYVLAPFLKDHASAEGKPVDPALNELSDDLGWLQWPGYWGSTGDSGKRSPRGPLHHERQWNRPEEFHEGAKRHLRLYGRTFLADEGRTAVPVPRITARREDDRAVVTYDFGPLEGEEAHVPVRLLVSVQRRSSRRPPSTHSFDVATGRGKLVHPASLGRGRYRVLVTAFDAADLASRLVRADVDDPASPPPGQRATGTRGAVSTTPPFKRDREAVHLRLVVDLPPRRKLTVLARTAHETLGPDADGAPWQVEPLFAPEGDPPRSLRGYVAVSGQVAATGPEPLSAVAFELARRLSDAAGVPVEPDLPSSLFSQPPADDGLRRSAGGGAEDAPQDRAWALKAARFPEAWELEPTQGAGILIGHPDTGFTDHPELEPDALDLTLDRDIITGDDDAHDPLTSRLWWRDFPGHGTGTASVIAGRAAGELVGAAPGATLVPLRTVKSVIQVFDGDVAKAVEYARSIGCQVISMSLGGVGFVPGTRAAMAAAVDAGLIVMAAAGNYVRIVTAPARFPECIAVAATNVAGIPWKHSSRGPEVDFAAPGENVWAAGVDRHKAPPDRYYRGPRRGTSFAVAHAAGAAALWLAHHRDEDLPDRYGGQLQAAFLAEVQASVHTPEGWESDKFGAGILDVEKLLLRDPPTSAPPARTRTAAADTPVGPIAPAAALFPEIAEAELRSLLAGMLNVPDGEPDVALEPFVGELTYLLAERPDLRRRLQPGAEGRARAAGTGTTSVAAELRQFSSPSLAARLT